jgi:hypothetical protein
MFCSIVTEATADTIRSSRLLAQVMVEKLRPEALPHEISLEADLPQIKFRQLRQEWIDMGYGVDPIEAQKKFDGLTDM